MDEFHTVRVGIESEAATLAVGDLLHTRLIIRKLARNAVRHGWDHILIRCESRDGQACVLVSED